MGGRMGRFISELHLNRDFAWLCSTRRLLKHDVKLRALLFKFTMLLAGILFCLALSTPFLEI